MNDKITNPIDFLIEFAWANGADKFTVNNAKDQLKKLRQQSENDYILCGWSRTNDRGDIYDLRRCFNPHVDNETVLPIYVDKTQFSDSIEKLKKRLTG